MLIWSYNELAPTNAPTWMDGAVIGLSLLSLCHPMLIFFVCLFSILISVFFLQLYLFFTLFLVFSPLSQFLFGFFPYPPPTYRPLSIYLSTWPSTFLLTNILSRYLPNPTYMTTLIYLQCTPKFLSKLNCKSKCENNGRIRNRGTLFGL